VLAEAIAGDFWKTISPKVMTTARRAVGHDETVYRMPGMPDDNQVTTARESIAPGPRHPGTVFPRITAISRRWRFQLPRYSPQTTIACLQCRGVDGIKTGYTRASGFNLVIDAPGHRHLIGV